MEIRGRIIGPKAVKDPPSMVPLEPATVLKSKRREESQGCCVSVVSLSQLSSDRAVKTARSLLQLPVKKVPLWFLDGQTC